MNTTDPTLSDYTGPCPRCGGPVPSARHQGKHAGAVSRADGESYVCSRCGSVEAIGEQLTAEIDELMRKVRAVTAPTTRAHPARGMKSRS